MAEASAATPIQHDGHDVYRSGGACLRHADLQQPCLSGGGRYAAKAMLIYPMYVYKIEVVS